jgi:hypothetical protein
MKKCLLTILLFLVARLLPACMAQGQIPMQEDPAMKQARMQRVEAFKIAYINQELHLTPDEARTFWPLYNQYQNELHSAVTEHATDEIARDEAVLDIRKKYQNQFSGILGNRMRANHVFETERQFNVYLLRQLHNRIAPQRIAPPRRMPMNRKGF